MPVHIPVQYNDRPQNIGVEYICSHKDAYIEKACCTHPDSDGNYSCGCGGHDSVICPNSKCQGISDGEVDSLYEKLIENMVGVGEDEE